MKNVSRIKYIIIEGVVFLILTSLGLMFGYNYCNKMLLEANCDSVIDNATIIANSYKITDAEVAYMKTLSFNEMERDSINQRLIEYVENTKTSTAITNIYVASPLNKNEVKYTADKETAKFFGCDKGAKLDVIWLLNGKFENNKFIVATRDDIYRYTENTTEYTKAFKNQKSYGTYSDDEWGTFISGYAPLYTVEGNYVGILGIDMDPATYRTAVSNTMRAFIAGYVVVVLVLLGLFWFFYYKYTKNKEEKLYYDFYSRMSHDMRTPMNGILGMVHLSKDENDNEVLHDYFSKIESSSEYLLSLINDTLDVSRIKEGKMTLNTTDISCNEIIDSINNIVASSCEDHNIKFEVVKNEFNYDTVINIDPIRVKQILVNLLTNAVKYTPNGGNIILKISSEMINDSNMHAHIVIQDSGVGMSEAFISNHLYHAFRQEHNSLSDQYSGSGLGLSITKNLVELMGGTIQCTSELNVGTKFTVDIDFPVVSNVKRETKKSIVQDINLERLKDKHILMCEDHKINAEIAIKVLAKVGCHVDLATNGKIGIEMFTSKPEGYYDAILMDIRMPVLDGIQTTKQIRHLDRKDSKEIPIIAMTANAYPEDIKASKEAGMNNHLSKPIKIEMLYQTLNNLIQ